MSKRVVLRILGGVAVALTLASLAVAVTRSPPKSAYAQRTEALREERLEPRFERLKQLHAPKPPPRPGEWLATYPEPGQSFAQYVARKPARPTPERGLVYFMPIGEFEGAQRRILEATLDYTGHFFGLPVKMLDAVPADDVPDEARRRNPITDDPQLLTTWLMEQKLAPAKPADAIALIGLTAVDLYPEPTWNYVFGEALPEQGIGIWSIARFGDPSTPAGFSRCLRRTLTTATHEIGHLFGVDHCVAWECQMNGSNHLEEADSRPLDLCPACLQKLTWFTGSDPAVRFSRLAQFARAQGFEADAAFLERSAEVVAERGP